MADLEHGEAYPGSEDVAAPVQESPLQPEDVETPLMSGGEPTMTAVDGDSDPISGRAAKKKTNWLLIGIIGAVLIAVVVVAIMIISRKYKEDEQLPIIYIPTMSVSALHVLVTGNFTVPGGNVTCPQGKFQVYPNATMRSGKYAPCTSLYLSSSYNTATKQYSYPKGVNVSIEWGSGSGLISEPSRFSLLSKSVAAMVDAWDYVHGKSYAVAPYDWRLSPKQLAKSQDFGEKLRAQVDQMFDATDGKKVHLLGHGTGALVAYEFLLSADDPWKTKKIASLISVGAPWAGFMNLWNVLSFDRHSFWSGLLDADDRSKEALLYSSFPMVSTTYADKVTYKDHVILNAPTLGNKTVPQTSALLATNLKKPGFASRWAAESTPPPTKSPGVDTYCLVGRKTATLSLFQYHNTSLIEVPTQVTNTTGDGLVDSVSLLGCRAFQNATLGAGKPEAGHKFELQEFDHVQHVQYFTDTAVQTAIRGILDSYEE